ncbi:MAG: putative lipid II flippase FtsW [Deltaproteobacteria bacterium]|nr:putative lipid II flippase FtsW [Deltaproteobacteria bacterium]
MGDKAKAYGRYNLMILIPVILLMALGLLMVYSASNNIAEHRFGDSNFYLKKQVLFCALGIVAMLIARYIPCTLYKKLVYPLLLLSVLLLAALFVPGLGRKVGGAYRWINLGGFSFQPSEMVKFSLAVYLAYSMSKKGSDLELFTKGLLPHLLVVGVFMVLIYLQPDLGTAVIIGAWALVLLFVGGVRILQLLALLLLAAPFFAYLVWNADYRVKRWLAFLNPWDDPKGIGFQIIHSFLAFGSGGIFGAGLGNSKQKLFYLPEPHTDFVLSIMGEELGLLGVTVAIVLFGILIMGGIRIALNTKDLYSSYLALGLTCFLGLQVIVNMAVVLGLLPTKGLTLPFISYGGSSLVMTLAGIGVLLNISSRNSS